MPTQQTMPIQAAPDNSGIVWDAQPTQSAPASTPDSTGITWDSQPTPSTQQPTSDELQINPSGNILTQAAQGAGGIAEGIGEGLFKTAAGTSDLIDKIPGMTPGPVNAELHTLAGDNNAQHGTSQSIGLGAENLAEFLGGDELLKGLTASQKYLKIGKLLETVESSPTMTRIVNAGVRALRGGAVGGTQALLNSGGNAGDTLHGAEAGALGNAILPEAADAAKAGVKALPGAVDAIKKPFSLKAVQEALQGSKDSIQQALQGNLQGIQDSWHGSIRDLFDQVASEAGVKPNPADSLRDVAANVADAVKSKASAIYRQIDNALGGTRFQTFDEQLNNVRRALRNSAGIDPDSDGRLIERINDLEDAKSKAMDQAKAAGVDPDLISQGNAAWRQASALEDLSKHLQASTTGLRGDLAQGVQAAPEALSPVKLASRANRMYSSGRLQQALGDTHADNLLKSIEGTKQSLQDAATKAAQASDAAASSASTSADSVKFKRKVAGTILAGVPGVALLKHLLSE